MRIVRSLLTTTLMLMGYSVAAQTKRSTAGVDAGTIAQPEAEVIAELQKLYSAQRWMMQEKDSYTTNLTQTEFAPAPCSDGSKAKSPGPTWVSGCRFVYRVVNVTEGPEGIFVAEALGVGPLSSIHFQISSAGSLAGAPYRFGTPGQGLETPPPAAPTPDELRAALEEAVVRGDVFEVEQLLKAGTKPLVQPVPLIVLAANKDPGSDNDLAIVRALVKQGANINASASQGQTALIMAARRGNRPMVNQLLSLGADPNLANPDNGHTPLMAAAGFPKVAQALLKKGAKLETKDKAGRTAATFAAFSVCPQAVEFFRQQGAKLGVPDRHGKTAEQYFGEMSKTGVAQGICQSR